MGLQNVGCGITNKAGLSIPEALGKLNLGGPMLSNLACAKIYDPFIGPFNVHLYACCANSMGLHGDS